MKNRIFAAIVTAAVVLSCGGNNYFSDLGGAKSETDIIKEQFTENGVTIEKCNYSAEDNVLSVTIISDTAGDTVSSDDIAVLRKARNTVRYNLSNLKSPAVYNEVLKNSAGDILTDSDINLTRLPEFEECKKLLGNIGTENKSLTPESINYKSSVGKTDFECRYDPYIGNTLFLTINIGGSDYSQLNEEIENIIYWIDVYNKENCSVQQLELNISDNGRQIFYMSADLVYRDFLWRQAPETERQ